MAPEVKEIRILNLARLNKIINIWWPIMVGDVAVAVPVADRTRLLSGNGSGYVSRAFRDYLRLVAIKHILAAHYHLKPMGN